MEINAYIDGERAKAIGNRKDPGALFVSGIDSNSPGRPISKRRYQQMVEEACVKAGLVVTEQLVDPETGNWYEVQM